MNDRCLITEKPALPELSAENRNNLNVSLRVMGNYIVQSDDVYCYIDVFFRNGDLYPAKQFNINLISTDLKKSELSIPKFAEGGVSMQVNGRELVTKLRALADRLDFELP